MRVTVEPVHDGFWAKYYCAADVQHPIEGWGQTACGALEDLLDYLLDGVGLVRRKLTEAKEDSHD